MGQRKESPLWCEQSRTGFELSISRVAPNDYENYTVGNKQNVETAQRDHSTVDNNDYLYNIGVYAGKLSNQREITENAVHYIGTKERPVHNKAYLNDTWMKEIYCNINIFKYINYSRLLYKYSVYCIAVFLSDLLHSV